MLPLDIIFSKEEDEQYNQLTKMYSDIANAVNGIQGTWTPTVEGGTTAGVGTYTTQEGYYYRHGLLVDCWFSIVLSGHTGTGDMKIKLPYKIKLSSDLWIGELLDSGLVYPSGTKIVLSGLNNTYFLQLVASGDAMSSANVQIDTVCTLTGHIRFIGQAEGGI